MHELGADSRPDVYPAHPVRCWPGPHAGRPATGDSGGADRERLPPMVAELPGAHRPAPPRRAVHGFPLAWAGILEPGPASWTHGVLAAHLDDAGRLSDSCTHRPASTPTAGRKPYGLASVAHLGIG
jgi:hypothetical protein